MIGVVSDDGNSKYVNPPCVHPFEKGGGIRN
jgi:hypothetical protein